NGIVTDLGVGAAGTLGFKPSGQFQNSSYACASLAWVKTGTGTSSVYTFVTVSFINAVMNALFNSGNDPTLDAASVVLGGEIKWADTNGTHETQTFNLTVLNEINRGGETVPVTGGGTAPTYLSSVSQLTGNVVIAGVAISLDAVPTAGFFAAGALVFVVIAGSISF